MKKPIDEDDFESPIREGVYSVAGPRLVRPVSAEPRYIAIKLTRRQAEAVALALEHALRGETGDEVGIFSYARATDIPSAERAREVIVAALHDRG